MKRRHIQVIQTHTHTHGGKHTHTHTHTKGRHMAGLTCMCERGFIDANLHQLNPPGSLTLRSMMNSESVRKRMHCMMIAWLLAMPPGISSPSSSSPPDVAGSMEEAANKVQDAYFAMSSGVSATPLTTT